MVGLVVCPVRGAAGLQVVMTMAEWQTTQAEHVQCTGPNMIGGRGATQSTFASKRGRATHALTNQARLDNERHLI